MIKVTRKGYGPVEGLELVDVPVPVPGENELLIQNKASSVNRTDQGVLLGKPFIFRFFVGYPKPRFLSTGTDFSGIVAGKGKNVSNFKIGEEVYGFSDHNLGSHSEYFCINADQPILQKPSNISHIEAAASLEGAHYAYFFLKKLKITPDSKIMVNGATGAIGNAMIQILNYNNTKVVFTYPTDSFDKVKNLNAVKMIDYKTDDFTQQNEEFDFILDAVGKSSFGACKKILKPHGVYVSSELGPGGENIPLSIWGLFHNKKRVVFPFPNSPKESMPFIKNLLEKGAFKPLIEKTYSISEIQSAFKHMLTGEKRGSIIIDFEK
jgi:NADPH:quinone reductase-like Zn-dependent oxidoreductase